MEQWKRCTEFVPYPLPGTDSMVRSPEKRAQTEGLQAVAGRCSGQCVRFVNPLRSTQRARARVVLNSCAFLVGGRSALSIFCRHLSMRRTLCPQLFHGTTLSLRALQALSASHLNERCASWKLWRSEVSEWYEEEQQQRWCQETDDEDEPDEEEEEFNTSIPHASSSTRCDGPSLPSSRRDQLAEKEAADAIEMHEWYEEQCERDSRHLSRWRASAERLRNLLHAQSTQMGCCCCGAPG